MRLVIVLLLVFAQGAVAQTRMYDVNVLGGDVGDMSLKKVVSGNKKTYVCESYTVVNYGLGKRKDHYYCKMEFKDNVLVSSFMENKKNGKVTFYTYIDRVEDQKGYKVQTEKGLSTIAGKITYCCYDIFFKEPKDGDGVFSERWGKFGTIKKLKDHQFKFMITGGKNYTYHYESGALKKFEVPTFLGKCKFTLK